MKLKFFTLFFLFSIAIYSKNIKVDRTNDKNTYNSLKVALQNSNSWDDTIFIYEGIYREHDINITHPVTIIGKNFPVIDIEFKSKGFVILADSVSIIGLKIVNIAQSYKEDLSAIKIKKQTHFNIEGNIFDHIYFGIHVEASSKGIIKNNKITAYSQSEFNSGNAIHVWHCKHITIEGNTVEGTRDGIYLEFVNNSVIKNNISKNNLRYGLHFMFSNDDVYINNTFENNGAGVAVMFSKRIKMYENHFQHNWGPASYGLLLKEIYDGEIRNNIFFENTIGINIDGTNRIETTNNIFKQNGWAIKVLGGCYKNNFIDNNFFNNTFDLAYNGSLNGNVFYHNYWSSYSGYDLDKDGFGDIVYRPVKLFSYIVNKAPEAIILIRSLFIDILDFSEKVSPLFTPENLIDKQPRMKAFYDRN